MYIKGVEDTEKIITIEVQSFNVCNTDGIEGLSWHEVQNCDAKYCDNLIKDVGLVCPTEDNFDEFDSDKNGIITWSEWIPF